MLKEIGISRILSNFPRSHSNDLVKRRTCEREPALQSSNSVLPPSAAFIYPIKLDEEWHVIAKEQGRRVVDIH
jgi:hypothetical protein